MKKFFAISILCLLALQAFGQQEHKATVWGVRSDGVTDNTGSIQRAVDYISEHGGGTLVFYVGRYLTGAIELKSNVTIRLEEAAVLVASTNIYSYKGAPALIWADGADNVGLTGKGVIEGRGKALAANMEEQKEKGFLPSDTAIPTLISFENCTQVTVGEEIKLLSDTAASTSYKAATASHK